MMAALGKSLLMRHLSLTGDGFGGYWCRVWWRVDDGFLNLGDGFDGFMSGVSRIGTKKNTHTVIYTSERILDSLCLTDSKNPSHPSLSIKNPSPNPSPKPVTKPVTGCLGGGL